MMAFLEFIPKPVLLALLFICAVATGWFYIEANRAVQAEKDAIIHEEKVRNDHAQLVIEAEKATAAAQDKARAAEYELQTQMTEQRRITDEKVTALTADADALKLRLSKARAHLTIPAVPASGPAAPASPGQAPAGNDQPQLSPTVGGLVDEARRADVIRLNLLDCYKHYDDGKAALEK